MVSNNGDCGFLPGMAAHHPAPSLGHLRNGDGGETTANLSHRDYQFVVMATGLMIIDLLLLPGRVPDTGTHERRKGTHAGNSNAVDEVHRPEVRPEIDMGMFRVLRWFLGRCASRSCSPRADPLLVGILVHASVFFGTDQDDAMLRIVCVQLRELSLNHRKIKISFQG